MMTRNRYQCSNGKILLLPNLSASLEKFEIQFLLLLFLITCSISSLKIAVMMVMHKQWQKGS